MFKYRFIFVLAILCFNQPLQAQALPQLLLNIENSDQFGIFLDPHYANLLSDTSALGIEIGFGAQQFRLQGTWSKIFECQHLLRFTSEYLSQDILFVFNQIPTRLWNEQPAFGIGYSYLLRHYGISSLNLGIYESRGRDENLHPRTYDLNGIILYRDVKGSNCCGGYIGLTFQPWNYTRLDASIYYDDIRYRNEFEPVPSRSGLGGNISLEQVIHPRILLDFELTERVIYNQYAIKASWLLPAFNHSKLEIYAKSEYLSGDLPHPQEKRVALGVSYRWDLPQNCPTYLTPRTMQEDVVAAAMKPAVRMPQVLVAREEHNT